MRHVSLSTILERIVNPRGLPCVCGGCRKCKHRSYMRQYRRSVPAYQKYAALYWDIYKMMPRSSLNLKKGQFQVSLR